MVTAPAGILGFLWDLGSDWFRPQQQKQTLIRRESADNVAEMQRIDRTASNLSQRIPVQSPQLARPPSVHNVSDPPKEKPPASQSSSNLLSILRQFSRRFPATSRTVQRLPIPLLPFAMCEFILVRGLAQRGWISVFASGFANACTTPARTVFFMGFVSAAFLCPLAGTNIGATIILVEILRDSNFSQSEAVLRDERVLLGAIYAVAMGSNIGAFSYTFAGSLAGLLWRGLLSDKGIHISQLKFAMVNAIPLLMQITVSSAIILGQLYWFV